MQPDIANGPSGSGSPSGGDAVGGTPIRRRGGTIYFAATFFAQACALLRYIVMARLLGPEQLGLAATLVLTGSFFDLISDTGSDRFLIQDRHGGTTQVQNLTQLVGVSRGVVTAVCLVTFSVPIAYFYHQPRLAGALAVLAIAPLTLGFLNLDIRRQQRTHDFRSQAISMLAAELSGLVATVTAAWVVRDFTAILYGLITRAVVLVLVSHLRAERPFRPAWSREHAPRLARFAAPLMLNGFMLFIVSQGDRVIVGNQLGPEALGFYSSVFLLIYYPTVLVAEYVHAMYIPMIAAQRDSPSGRDAVCDDLGAKTFLLGILMVVGFAIVAPALVPILFGRRFEQSALLVGLIGILQGARYLISWPSIAALAIGRSVTVLVSNLAQLIAFAGAFIGLWLMGGLLGVVAGFILGEFIAIAVALTLLNRNLGRGPLHGFDRLLAFTGACGAIVGWSLALSSGRWPAQWGMLILSAALGLWLWRRESAAIVDLASLADRYVRLLFSSRKNR